MKFSGHQPLALLCFSREYFRAEQLYDRLRIEIRRAAPRNPQRDTMFDPRFDERADARGRSEGPARRSRFHARCRGRTLAFRSVTSSFGYLAVRFGERQVRLRDRSIRLLWIPLVCFHFGSSYAPRGREKGKRGKRGRKRKKQGSTTLDTQSVGKV